jgi:hypothetical protein
MSETINEVWGAVGTESQTCRLADLRPGLFVYGYTIGFKSEYAGVGPFVVESGEIFQGGAATNEERDNLQVYPCHINWRNL